MPLILNNAPDTDFREIGTLFIVSFPRPSYVNEYGTDSAKQVNDGKRQVPEVPKRRFLKDESIDPSEKIMALMRSDPSITTLAIGKAMGISDRAVRKRITKMREAGFLLRTGGRKGGHWEVLK